MKGNLLCLTLRLENFGRSIRRILYTNGGTFVQENAGELISQQEEVGVSC